MDKATDIFDQYNNMVTYLEKKQFLSQIFNFVQSNPFKGTKLTLLAFSFKVLASSNSDNKSIDVRRMSVEDVSSTV